MNIRTWVVAAVLGVAVSASAQSARQYVDTSAYLTSEADINAWYQLTSSLKQNFDDVCGDTFCEGDYSNITPLRFQCSVQLRSGRIGACSWSFAASNEEIDPASGQLSVDAPTWQCSVPLAPQVTIDDLLVALAGNEPLHATLPGGAGSIYDALGDCL